MADSDVPQTLGDIAMTFLRDLQAGTRDLDWVDVSKWDYMLEPTEDNRNMLMMLMGHQLVPHIDQFTHTRDLLNDAYAERNVEKLDHALDMAHTDFDLSGLSNFLVVNWDLFQDPVKAVDYYDELVELYFTLIRGIDIAREWNTPQ